jgi:hypothetical protein
VNLAVLEVVGRIADNNKMKVRDVTNRLRKLRVEFRTESYQGGEPLETPLLLGYSYDGFFFTYAEEVNQNLLERLVVEGQMTRDEVTAYVDATPPSKALAVPEPEPAGVA